MDKETIMAIIEAIQQLGIAGKEAFIIYLVFRMLFWLICATCFIFAIIGCLNLIKKGIDHWSAIARIVTMSRMDVYESEITSEKTVQMIIDAIRKDKSIPKEK